MFAYRNMRLRYLVAPAAMAASTGLTLAIPLLALNAEVAREFFPTEEIDLASAGRQPNILILAADGTELGSRGSELGEPVKLTELPPFVIDSFLATEDRNFFHHPGFDPAAMIRAMIINYRAGTVKQGGSTITQQLVKNLFLSGEQTLSRKFEELHLALWLEARLTKEEILELYLNRIYLGANTYGLDAASEAYFSKPPEELTLAEAALIAGLPKAPSKLAPHANYEGAVERSREVIQNLVEAGRVDKMTARMATMFPPELHLKDRADGAGYFMDHVAVELLRELPGLGQDVVVTTTLRPGVQEAAELAVTEVIENDTALAKGAEQAALVAYDREGGIAAMIGGRSYRESQFNRATQARRQPGSAFKPFIFLAALENGFDQDTVLFDQAVSVDGWQPSNYKERFLGPHRMREALARSSNTATVQITEAVGRDVVIDTARRLGLDSGMAPHPSIALGVFEVPLNELTAAYLPFSHDGFASKPHTITEVRTRKGELLYVREPFAAPRVISTSTAERMTDLLKSVAETGTGRAAQVPGHEIAGKTGTTNEWRDAWFVGYSAHLTAGVWVGNDDNRAMNEVSGATYPAQIWKAFMTGAHEAMNAAPTPLPDGIEPHDPQMWQLSQTYDALYDDLMYRAYGVKRRWRPDFVYDGIGNILNREQRGGRDRVEGRIADNDTYRPNDGIRAQGVRPGPQVSGRVVPPDGGQD